MRLDKVNFLCYTILGGLERRYQAECDNQAQFYFGTAEMLKSQKRQKHVICDVYPYVSGEFTPLECHTKRE